MRAQALGSQPHLCLLSLSLCHFLFLYYRISECAPLFSHSERKFHYSHSWVFSSRTVSQFSNLTSAILKVTYKLLSCPLLLFMTSCDVICTLPVLSYPFQGRSRSQKGFRQQSQVLDFSETPIQLSFCSNHMISLAQQNSFLSQNYSLGYNDGTKPSFNL